MKKTILIYGLALAGLTTLLKVIEYKFLVRDISMEIYLGVIALFFTIIGVWAGTKIINRKTIVQEVPVMVERQAEFVQNEAQIKKLGISQREYEVLQLMSEGLSNQEIGEKLFISLPTVKTHATKLDVKRRTQAVQRAKELLLIP
ncbi:MAG: DNA-binding response regulator [Taibaiella sp.]|nr:DNA-binding response regulator [Taibaiella sp.]